VSCGVAIFVKTPALSPVKTRLWASIGRRAAETLHLLAAEAVASVVEAARNVAGLEGYWAVAEREALHSDAWMDLRHVPQGGGGLGDRMAQVYASLQRRHGAAILLGADCPQIYPDLLRDAAARLQGPAPGLVFGPAFDGGFWLFGGNRPIDVDAWLKPEYSRADTGVRFRQAMQRFGAWNELALLRDIDTSDDIVAVANALRALVIPTPAQQRLLEWLDGVTIAPRSNAAVDADHVTTSHAR
jgi:glycosyltransferase A (GT-A) superfamily protein (DUF2064 family)